MKNIGNPTVTICVTVVLFFAPIAFGDDAADTRDGVIAANAQIVSYDTGWYLDGVLEDKSAMNQNDVDHYILTDLIPFQRYIIEIAISDIGGGTLVAAIDTAGNIQGANSTGGEFGGGKTVWRAGPGKTLSFAVATSTDLSLSGGGIFDAGQYAVSVRPEGKLGCVVDINGDGLYDNGDTTAFISAFQFGDTIADINGDGIIDNGDIALFVSEFFAMCRLPDEDLDQDRIPDRYERMPSGSSQTFDRYHTGTGPLADTDGDAINDGDEVLGTNRALPLPTMGANPLVRDIFLECDWVNGFYRKSNGSWGAANTEPDLTVAQSLENAFANGSSPSAVAPVQLHFDFGNLYPFLEGGIIDPIGVVNVNGTLHDEMPSKVSFDVPGVNSPCPNTLPGSPTCLNFTSIKNDNKNFNARRNNVFHYALSVNSIFQGGGGFAQLSGKNLIASPAAGAGFLPNVLASTIFHELGHNLGLQHGGDVELPNYKPNYVSSMNYRYANQGIDLDGDAIGDGATFMNYSHGDKIDLNENSLNEAGGIGAGVGIDWNNDGDATDIAVVANINIPTHDMAFPWMIISTNSVPCGMFPIDSWGVPYGISSKVDNTCDILKDYDDWANLDFTGILAP